MTLHISFIPLDCLLVYQLDDVGHIKPTFDNRYIYTVTTWYIKYPYIFFIIAFKRLYPL